MILAKTIKGYGMGSSGEAANETHSIKKMDLESLKKFRDALRHPAARRRAEGRALLPAAARQSRDASTCASAARHWAAASRAAFVTDEQLPVPALDAFAAQLKGSAHREISTTMAFVRLLSTLVKDPGMGERVVPIVPDEARTFGMEGMFRQLGIYSSMGQRYTPHDSGQILFYKEDIKGQILEEGINEAGAMSAWIAAATSYANHNLTQVPFYIFYSMFGFQRIGDLAWAAGDQRARGFLIGATSGRTTLNGEGLQHQDGHSHLVAATIPNCVSYDPTYAYEVAVIVHHGLEVMYGRRESKFFYITTMNENYQHPEMPAGVEEGIIRGMYRVESAAPKAKTVVQLMGCGSILREVRGGRGAAAPGLRHRRRRVEPHQHQRAAPRRPRRRALEPAAPHGEDAAGAVRHADAGWRDGARDRVHRLHQGLGRRAAALHPAALRGAGHGRLRTQRHARSPAAFLRGRPALRGGGGAEGAGRRGAHQARAGGGSDCEIRHRSCKAEPDERVSR